MTKILMVAPTTFFSNYGASVRILEECNILLNMGLNVRVCTYKNGENPSKLPIYRIPFSHKKLKTGPSWHRIFLDGMLLSSVLIHSWIYSPEIVHVHLHEGILCSIPTRPFARIPVIADLQDSLTDELIRHGLIKSNGLSSKIISVLERTLVTSADIIICSGPLLYSYLKEKLGQKCVLIPDCVDTEKFSPRPKRWDIIQKFHIPKDRKIIAYLGTLSPLQGTDILLKAIKILLKKYQDVHFLVMGFPNIDKYKLLAENLHISEHVTFTGEISYYESPSFLSLADIAVAPKLCTMESNGKILLYLSMGLPTVVFDNPINRFFLGKLGIYAEKENPEYLAEAIVRALKTIPDKPLSVAMRERAIKLFSKQVFQKKLLGLYKQILN